MRSLWFKSILMISVSCMICLSAVAAESKSSVSKRSSRFDSAPTSSTDSIKPDSDSRPTSVTEATPTGEKKPVLPFSLTGSSIFTGPPVNNITSASTADDAVGAQQSLNTRNFIAISHKLDDQLTLSGTLDFFLKFTDTTNVKGEPREFTWGNPFIRLKHTALVKDKIGDHDFSLGGSVDYLTPVDFESRQSYGYGSVRAGLTPSLQFAHSNFSLAALGFARYWVQSRDQNPASGSPLKQMQFYGGPQVNYNLSDKVTAFVLYEATIRMNTLGQWEGGTVWHAGRSLTDVEPGINFQITDGFALTPYLNWFCNQPLSTTAVNLNLSLTML